MADIIIPQGGATNPVIPAAQDLQINLADAPKVEEITTPENKGPELNLDLDLNLSDAPKDDDRLKTEDQKNNQVIETPAVEIAPVESTVEMPVAAEPTLLETTPEAVAEITQLETPMEQTIETPVIEQAPVENTVEEIINPEPIVETVVETPVAEEVIPVAEEISTPSTTIEAIPSSSEVISGNPPEGSSLKEDMKMIDELEGHPSAGGLAPEAVVIPQPTPVEAPKTFDLDAMLGGPATPPVVEATQTPIVQADIPMPQVMPAPTAAPMQAPAFTIPTTTTQVPVQALMQTSIPQNKNKGVKALLFTVMFAALGFTTFFILKTMYPLEFGSMFSSSQPAMHASEITTGTEETGTELTGLAIPTEVVSGTIDTGTGTHESAPATEDAFGALSDLGTTPAPTTETPPTQDNVSRLTDYVTQGNKCLEEGKTLQNNTVIKYCLYISKKATTFLEDIANGKEINNLSGYFAQFDQYTEQLKVIMGAAPTTDPATTTETTTETTASPTPPVNDFQMSTDSTTTAE